MHPGFVDEFQQYSGFMFKFVESSGKLVRSSGSGRKPRHCHHALPLAVGGRYDKLLDLYRRPTSPTRDVSVVGVSICEEVLVNAAFKAYQQGTVSWLLRVLFNKRGQWKKGIDHSKLRTCTYICAIKGNVEDGPYLYFH